MDIFNSHKWNFDKCAKDRHSKRGSWALAGVAQSVKHHTGRSWV